MMAPMTCKWEGQTGLGPQGTYMGGCVTPRDRRTVRPVGERAGQHRLSKEKQARQGSREGGRFQALHRHALTQACQLKFGQQRNKCLCEILQWLLNMMFSCEIWPKS